MDWSESEMQEAVGGLAKQVFHGESDPWAALVESQVLELDGMLEIATLLVEAGRAGAAVPVFETLVLGAPIAQFGTAVPAGTVLTAGLIEAQSRDPRRARTRIVDGKLSGEKVCVPWADKAEFIVVPTADGVAVARLADCAVTMGMGTHDQPVGTVSFDGVPCERLGGDEVLDWWLPRVDVGVCALLYGLSKQALILTAKYLSDRKQFGRSVGSFQAVQQRAADAWIDLNAMEVTLWQAAWRVSEGLGSERERAIARYWASEGAHNVTAAAQHLHGGFGFDRDYAVHRYFLAVKQHEFLLGGANAQLEALGDVVAAS
ncbi:MAG: acyl-CoA dehydrogenase [Proteobacteria bacterium]|nr:acyl-CoA dehydrogenase [Pseudomonadota bacterium]